MDLVNNGDKELIAKHKEIYNKHGFFRPMNNVFVECEDDGMRVRATCGYLCVSSSNGNSGRLIKRSPFNWFGLKRIAPFQHRVQAAVDKLQRGCDEDMWRKIRQYEMNQRLNPRTPSTPPHGGSGVPPKQK